MTEQEKLQQHAKFHKEYEIIVDALYKASSKLAELDKEEEEARARGELVTDEWVQERNAAETEYDKAEEAWTEWSKRLYKFYDENNISLNFNNDR